MEVLGGGELTVRYNSTFFEAIASGLSIVDGSIGETQLASEAVTADKIASAAVGEGLSGGAGTALTVNLEDSTLSKSGSGLKVTVLESATSAEGSDATSQYEVVYFNAAGNFLRAIADGSQSLNDGTKFGICIESSIAAAATGNIHVQRGYPVAMTGLTVGPVYLSPASKGAVVFNLSSHSSGDEVILLGAAESATSLRFAPRFMWIH